MRVGVINLSDNMKQLSMTNVQKMKESEKSHIFSWHCNLTIICLGQSYSLPMSYQPSGVYFINSDHSNPNLNSNLDNHQLNEYS